MKHLQLGSEELYRLMLTSTHCYIDKTSTLDDETELVAIFEALDGIDLTIQLFIVHGIVELSGKVVTSVTVLGLLRLGMVALIFVLVCCQGLFQVWVVIYLGLCALGASFLL